MGRFDEIPDEVAVYEARNAVFWMHDGLMYGRHLVTDPQVTLEDAITVIGKLKEMTGGTRVPLMFDGRGLTWLNIDARGYIRAHLAEVFTHVAIVVRHELVRVLSHAFLGVAGIGIPMRFFTDEDEAWEYLTAVAA